MLLYEGREKRQYTLALGPALAHAPLGALVFPTFPAANGRPEETIQ